MTTLEILRAARELISDPAKWTQGAYARSSKGEELYYGNNPEAVCWCAYGALEKVSGQKTFSEVPGNKQLEESCPNTNDNDLSVPAINDRLGHAAVLALYDRAIALAEQEEAAK